MSLYFAYMLKASVCLVVIYLFYFALLKRITYYTWNRYFLLTYSIFACIIPFINVDVFVESKKLDGISFISRLSSFPTNVSNTYAGLSFLKFGLTQLLSIVFLVGFSIMLVRLVIQLLSVWQIHSKATLLEDGQVRLYNTEEPIVPFSFFSNIYINKNNYTSDELAEIVKHELVHVRQNHTIDILCIELICLLNWYNPFVWLIKKAVKENLEFIADDNVVRTKADKRIYQYLLLKVTGNVSFSIANNLNLSSLKNRISMMNKTKTNRLHLIKYAFIFPVAAIVLLAFRNKHEVHNSEYEKQQTVTKSYVLKSLTYSIQNKKVESVVKADAGNCLLKTGQAINLELVVNEQVRLKEFLEKSGYNNIGKHAIIFMVDTTLGNNNFSIQININLQKARVTKSKELLSKQNQLVGSADNTKKLIAAGPLISSIANGPSNPIEDGAMTRSQLTNSNVSSNR